MFGLSKVLFLIILAVTLSAAGQNQPTIRASIDKQSVTTGELLRYTLVIDGVFSDPRLKLPEFENFVIVSQSRSQNYSQLKQGVKFTLKLVYVLYALEPGELVIPPAVVKDKTSEYKSNSLSIYVEGKPFKEKKKILPYLDNGTDI